MTAGSCGATLQSPCSFSIQLHSQMTAQGWRGRGQGHIFSSCSVLFSSLLPYRVSGYTPSNIALFLWSSTNCSSATKPTAPRDPTVYKQTQESAERSKNGCTMQALNCTKSPQVVCRHMVYVSMEIQISITLQTEGQCSLA